MKSWDAELEKLMAQVSSLVQQNEQLENFIEEIKTQSSDEWRAHEQQFESFQREMEQTRKWEITQQVQSLEKKMKVQSNNHWREMTQKNKEITMLEKEVWTL